ncbi:S-layer homology domain-containing protein [Bacillus sp. FJAT-28004]|uniref:S-layer homology domain-containing protein n=1 Tax=Bacillus sp. FJAT-28004 TaxID=1679165 RepID=UPI000AEFD74A|nr:S-layer homology domain-containing protein [Bacillus sp. FJAT-28004]
MMLKMRKIAILLLVMTVFSGTFTQAGLGRSVLLPSAHAASATLSLTVNQKNAAVGQAVEVVVKGEQLNDLYGFEFKLKYNTAKLKFKQASAAWKGMPISPIDKDGVITFAHTKIGKEKGVGGSAAIATFTFEGAANGKASFELVAAKLVDSQVKAVQLQNAAKLTLLLSSSTPASFNDTKGHWAEANIARAASLGIVTGFENGAFQPNGWVTRSQFVAMIGRAFELNAKQAKEVDFKDKGQFPAWAEAFIAEAVNADVISGYDDGTFRPSRQITRTEMVTMTMRTSGFPLDANAAIRFADAAQIPVWAKPAVVAAASRNLLKGRSGNRFEPQAKATRAEALTFILSLVDEQNK